MTNIPYSLIAQGDLPTLTLMLDGVPHTVTSAHARFAAIRDHLAGNAHDPDRVRSLLDMGAQVAEQMQRLSDRVTYEGGSIYFDGDLLDKPITRQMTRLIRESNGVLAPAHDHTLGHGRDGDSGSVGALVRFLDNLATNPSRQSRLHLYTWLSDREFTITADGMILGYKGVTSTEQNLSVNSGCEPVRVSVGGTTQTHVGQIPNPVGARIEMPRALVETSREQGCGIGLHVGTYEYASHWGTRLLHVLVNPRDVVSVPECSSYQKMRVARYEVLEASERRITSGLVSAVFTDDDGEGDDEAFGAFDDWTPDAEPDQPLEDDFGRIPSADHEVSPAADPEMLGKSADAATEALPEPVPAKSWWHRLFG